MLLRPVTTDMGWMSTLSVRFLLVFFMRDGYSIAFTWITLTLCILLAVVRACLESRAIVVAKAVAAAAGGQ